MQTVSALFVDSTGHYMNMPGVDPWPESRDARLYRGPNPVVAHPPCHLWVNMAAVNWKRYGRQRPAWYPGGDDGGCFASALASVRRGGGVLEHPAQSKAWDAHVLCRPLTEWNGSRFGWLVCPWIPSDGSGRGYWVCEVWQSAYGHKARKRTWLLYCGKRQPLELNWSREPGTHQVGWFDRNKPTLSKKEAILSPLSFAEELIRLARWSV